MSSAHWEHLDEWVRVQVRRLIQELLEEELTEFLGRAQSAPRFLVESSAGYRNGSGKPRCLTLGTGTVVVRRPRVRIPEERFQSRVLPLFARQITNPVESPFAALRMRTDAAKRYKRVGRFAHLFMEPPFAHKPVKHGGS
ncbi:MAG: hypothetical protein ABID84_03090 [Chloroflexota bacterium]